VQFLSCGAAKNFEVEQRVKRTSNGDMCLPNTNDTWYLPWCVPLVTCLVTPLLTCCHMKISVTFSLVVNVLYSSHFTYLPLLVDCWFKFRPIHNNFFSWLSNQLKKLLWIGPDEWRAGLKQVGPFSALLPIKPCLLGAPLKLFACFHWLKSISLEMTGLNSFTKQWGKQAFY
jgi:hypothetical protein